MLIGASDEVDSFTIFFQQWSIANLCFPINRNHQSSCVERFAYNVQIALFLLGIKLIHWNTVKNSKRFQFLAKILGSRSNKRTCSQFTVQIVSKMKRKLLK